MHTLSRRSLLQFAAAGVAAGEPKKNVLFIAIDDLNTRVGCYGHPEVKSPRVDRLARSGVRFERAYCQYPLCNPTRTSLLTGRRPPTTRVMDNNTWFRKAMPDVVTLPQHFRDNGYATAQVSKIFHGGLDDPKAWEIGQTAVREAPLPTGEQKKDRQRTADRWVPVDGEGEDQTDYRTATRAVELLKQLAAGDRPFFFGVGLLKPHVPLIAPKKFFDLYDPARIELPPDFAPEPVGKGPSFRPNFDLFINRQATPELARQGIAAYQAATSFMDAQLGRVLAAYDSLGLAKNTIIVFFGDHGWHLGEKGMWSKMSLYEPVARAPLIIVAPGMSPGKASARTVEFVDIYPTLVDLCGLPRPQGLEGRSLSPLLKNPGARWDKPAYTYVQRGRIMGATVRNERYRYTEWDEGRAGAELFDFNKDPHELRNLAQDAAAAGVVKTMRALLRNPVS